MGTRRLASPRLAPILGALAPFVALSLGAVPCRAQFGWPQSAPPEVVLGFQPRTPEEAARPPRLGSGLTPLVALARRSGATMASDLPGAVWTEWAPPGLCYHSLVRDSRRAVFYVVGGLQVLDPQGLVWRYEPEAGTCTPIATRPGGGQQYFGDAVYDSLRDRVLVLSQGSGSLSLDAMALPGLDWSRIWSMPAGTYEAPAAIAIDTRRDALVLLGLWDSDSAAQRIVRIPLADPVAWTTAYARGSPQPPGARYGAAVYDESRERFFVIFDEHLGPWYPGYERPGSSLWSVRALGEQDWTPIDLGPERFDIGPRAIERDARDDRLLIVDEHAGAWSLSPDGGLPTRLDDGLGVLAFGYNTRYGIAAAFDPGSRRLLAHGGQEVAQGLPMFMSLAVDPAAAVPARWASDEPGSAGSRWFHSLLFDPTGNRLIVVGGSTMPHNDNATPPTAVHLLDASTGWRQVELAGQPGRGKYLGSGYAFDHDRNAVLAFGGQHYGSGAIDDTLSSLPLTGGTWQPVPTSGPKPPARRWAQFFFDAPNDRFILQGGDDLQTYLTDAWELRMQPTPTWRPLAIVGESPAPYLAIFPDEWREGGWAISSRPYRPVYRVALQPDSLVLTAVPTVGDVPNLAWSMSGFCFDPLGMRLVGFLKRYDDVYFTDLYEVRLGSTATWNSLPTSGTVPSNRGFIAAAFDPGGSRLFMYGGYDDNQDYRGDTWQLQFFDAVTPVAISLAAATADAYGAHLRWRLGATFTSADVERSRDGVAWEPVGVAVARGDELAFDDAGLAPGESAAYRLRALSAGQVLVSEPAWVTAPAGAGPALSLRALPVAPGRAPSILVAAASGAEVRLNLLDVAGRRLEGARLEGGTHAHTFASRPPPGLYFAQAEQQGLRRVARVVITP